MRITQSALRRIIKEEIGRSIREADVHGSKTPPWAISILKRTVDELATEIQQATSGDDYLTDRDAALYVKEMADDEDIYAIIEKMIREKLGLSDAALGKLSDDEFTEKMQEAEDLVTQVIESAGKGDMNSGFDAIRNMIDQEIVRGY